MTSDDALTHAASEYFRDACDNKVRDSHPDLSEPRPEQLAFAYLGVYAKAAELWHHEKLVALNATRRQRLRRRMWDTGW